ncbi:unnamed protein product, partial [Larinioides sclopetarius]
SRFKIFVRFIVFTVGGFFTFSYRESIVIVKKFELEILTNLHVLDLPESKKHDFGIMSVCLSVCLSVNTITQKLL